jgi:hypothetical protein
VSWYGFRRWRVGHPEDFPDHPELHGMLLPGFVDPIDPPMLLPSSGVPGWAQKLYQSFARISPPDLTWSPDKETAAVCTLRQHHPAAAAGCKCGLWVHTFPVPPCGCKHPDDDTHEVVGVVRCWGQCVPHESGWRAQYAQPVALVDFTGRLDDRYFRTAARYPTLDAMYAEWAPDHGNRWADVSGPWNRIPQWCGDEKTRVHERARQRALREKERQRAELINKIMSSREMPKTAQVIADGTVMIDGVRFSFDAVQMLFGEVGADPRDLRPISDGIKSGSITISNSYFVPGRKIATWRFPPGLFPPSGSGTAGS